MKPSPQVLALTVPDDIIRAASLIDDWAKSHGIKAYQINQVCSRVYANAIQLYAPSLRKLRTHPNGMSVIQAHNVAIAQLKALVPTEVKNSNTKKN